MSQKVTISLDQTVLERLFAGGGEVGARRPLALSIAIGAMAHAAMLLANFEAADEIDDGSLFAVASQLESAIAIVQAITDAERESAPGAREESEAAE